MTQFFSLAQRAWWERRTEEEQATRMTKGPLVLQVMRLVGAQNRGGAGDPHDERPTRIDLVGAQNRGGAGRHLEMLLNKCWGRSKNGLYKLAVRNVRKWCVHRNLIICGTWV